MEPVLITSTALRKILSSYPYQCENFLPIQKDASYAAVPLDWFPKFVEWCRRHPLDPYEPEYYDCDDMAEERTAGAGEAFRESPIKGSTPAFLTCQLRIVPTSDYFGGKFEFDPNLHATCILYADDGAVWLYEPQANAFANLGELMETFVVGELSFCEL